MISSAVRGQAARYRSEFRTALPFPHIVIDGFLEADKAEGLLRDFPPFVPENAGNEFGEVGRKAVVPEIHRISPFYAKVYDYIASQEFLDFVAAATGIQHLVHDAQMFGGGTHENLEGQDLDPHVDFNYLADRGLHRRLNLLLYLNKEWNVAWGGCLELHSNPRRPAENQISVIAPDFNRAVIFETSERSWHGFERIRLPDAKKHLSRKMLSVYLYTRDRPVEETAPPHSTFYVQRPMKKHLIPGHALTLDDVSWLEKSLERRDHWIEFYQRKELEDSKRIQELLARNRRPGGWWSSIGRLRGSVVRLLRGSRKDPTSLADADVAQDRLDQPPPEVRQGEHAPADAIVNDGVRVRVLGGGMQEGPARGAWPDGWIGSPFEVAIRVETPVESIALDAFLPHGTLPEVELRARLNGIEAVRRMFRPGAVGMSVPVEAGAGDLIELRIRSDRTYCPRHTGAGADSRDLVVVLRSLRIVSANPAPA